MAWFMIHGNTVQYTKHARKLTKTLYVCTLYDRTIFWCFILQKYNFVVFLNAAFHYSISPYAYTNEQTLHCQRQLSLSLSHLSTAPLVIFIVIQRSVSQSVNFSSLSQITGCFLLLRRIFFIAIVVQGWKDTGGMRPRHCPRKGKGISPP